MYLKALEQHLTKKISYINRAIINSINEDYSSLKKKAISDKFSIITADS